MEELVIIKKFKELSINELGEVTDQYGDKVTNFDNFKVSYGKKWQLLKVEPCYLNN